MLIRGQGSCGNVHPLIWVSSKLITNMLSDNARSGLQVGKPVKDIDMIVEELLAEKKWRC